MLKIGDFSKLSRISIRMLRYYDENDVLKPAYIDESSGYRFYDSKQLYWASQISFLKETGFSTALIREILEHFHNVEEVKRYIHTRMCELKEEQAAMEAMIQRLAKAEELLDKEDMFMRYEVSVKEIKGCDAITTRGIIPSYDREDLLWKRLMSETKERKMDVRYVKEPPRAYFYDEGYKEHDVDVEICVPVSEKGQGSDHLKYRHLADQTCACATFKGNYFNTTDVCITIGQWISENGYELAGPNFCIYHVGYNETQNEEDFVTEICYPIKK